MEKKPVRYREGQWFAVPLRKGGYALGIIVRGSYKTKGGLGYFFGPRYNELPNEKFTLNQNPEEAILITMFGDLGLINGTWPLIPSTRPFSKVDWPIPKFGSKNSLRPGKAYIREYKQNDAGELVLDREITVDEYEIIGLADDRILGGGAVEIQLTNLLDEPKI